jgi:hypothetical protein
MTTPSNNPKKAQRDRIEQPPDAEEQFLKQVLALEQAEERPLFDVLTEDGFDLPDPDKLDEAQLSQKLWELMHELADRHAVLHCTDHLSDRELYTKLWSETLREDTSILPADSTYTEHIDLLGSGSDEDVHLYLKYYADEKQRQHYAEQFPRLVISEHCDPPYSRDHLLP